MATKAELRERLEDAYQWLGPRDVDKELVSYWRLSQMSSSEIAANWTEANVLPAKRIADVLARTAVPQPRAGKGER